MISQKYLKRQTKLVKVEIKYHNLIPKECTGCAPKN